MNVSSAFFLADRQKDKKKSITFEDKAMQIAHDLKANSVEVYRQDKLVFSAKAI